MLELKDVSKIYDMGNDNKVFALDRVSLEIRQGEYVCVVGPSGSGKSTMMNILGCLDVPTSGEYYVDGIEISKYTEKQLASLRNQKIGFIFQGFNLLPRLTALENVELPLIYQGMGIKERRKLAHEALAKVGMDHRANHKPTELSGGQQQRVAIARAIATSPRVILADEPTGNLDSTSGEEVIKILSDLNANGTTVVIITHNDEIAEKSRRVVKILDGKIVENSVRAKPRKKKSDELKQRTKAMEKPVKTRKKRTTTKVKGGEE